MKRLNVWPQIANAYLALNPAEGPLRGLLTQLNDEAPTDITTAFDRDAAISGKDESVRFLLFALHSAIADHNLSDDEMLDLRNLIRILRIEEGDVLAHHRQQLTDLLCLELERLLEDHAIDPTEAVHKVKLQELLGLGYDQFVALTSPQIDAVILRLIGRLDSDAHAGPSPDSIRRFQRQLAGLDTVYDRNPKHATADTREGYLHLLVNPSMPGLIKVGRTNRKPDQRVAELTGATGVPTPFILVYELFVRDCVAAEKYAHTKFEDIGARVAANREFFNASPSKAVEVMLEARNAVEAVGASTLDIH